MLERRTFLISCGCIAAGFAAARAGAAELAVIASPPNPREASQVPAIALHIRGWEAADPAEDAKDQIWIGINRSWRTAWR